MKRSAEEATYRLRATMLLPIRVSSELHGLLMDSTVLVFSNVDTQDTLEENIKQEQKR